MIYISIDTETSGLLRTDKVISFGAVLINVDTDSKTAKYEGFSEIFNDIDVKIQVAAKRVHGIDNEKLKELSEGKKTYQVSQDIKTLLTLPDRVLGYNIMFDLQKIEHTYPSIEPSEIAPYIDVMDLVIKKHKKRISLERITNGRGYEKDYLKDVQGTKMDGYHSAVFDAYVTARYYFEEKGYTWIS